ncbi:MAG: Fic family protein [Nitrosopumilus sp.]|nr:Fic family protein [Nitrosopumilus sp.]NRA05297.1 Fic family protein [Nitrosopumilus sp.]
MVSVVNRPKGNQDYYYLYHDSKKGTRKQREEYLGKAVPEDIEDRKKNFALGIEREEWIPDLEKIHKNYKKEQKNTPLSIQEKNLKNFSVKFTYNTQRIEGSTLTLKDTTLLLEDGLTPANRPSRDIKETEIHQKIFLEIMTQKVDLSLDVVKKWHKKLFEQTKPDIAGLLRDYDVGIGQSKFKPPPHNAVNLLVNGFFKWYATSKKKLNPVELAALVHLKFVTIHPFGDGNGRTTRLMMNYVLNKFDYPLLDIDYGDRRSYYNALEKSQTKDNDLQFLQWFMKRYFKTHKKYV